MTSIFEKIRTATSRVAQRARHVEIDDDALQSYADELPIEEIDEPERDAEIHYVGAGEATLAYVVTLDAINFGSGYFPWTQPRDGHTDYAMVATALRDRFERRGPFHPQELAQLSTEDCAELLAQEIQHEERRRLMASYAHVLGELGEHLIREYDASYTRFVEAADESADRLVDQLSAIPSFRDEVLYENETVPFYKRAQIMAADLHLAFDGSKWGHFDDIDELTLFADNRVPHVLRMDGVLSYGEELAERVDSRAFVGAGSPEEIEIRACAVHAVERLSEMLGARLADRDRVPPRLIDNYLWHRGRADRYRVRPAHRTRTTAY